MSQERQRRTPPSRRFGRHVLFAATALAALAGAAAAQTSPEGVWRTISDKDGQPRGLVRMELRDGALAGYAVGSLVPGEDPDATCDKCPGDLRGKPMKGMRIVWGLRQNPRNERVFEGGHVLDPDSGHIYDAKVTVAPDNESLTLRGFLGIETIGRSQTWQRDRAQQAQGR